MDDDRELIVVGQSRRGELAPAGLTRLAAPDTGRTAMRALFYVGLFGLAPAAGFYLYFGLFPYAAAIVLPRVAYTAARISAARHAAFEDTPPAVAALVLSGLVWAALAGAFPGIWAFDYAVTVVWQLIWGGFLVVLGPGTVLEWADLPRQIYFPRQPPPTHATEESRPVVRGQEVFTTATIRAERQAEDWESDSHPSAMGEPSDPPAPTHPDEDFREAPAEAGVVATAGVDQPRGQDPASHGELETPRQDDESGASASRALKRARRALGFLWGSIWFGGREFSNNNRFVIGMSGSGKTLTIRTLMASLLPWPKSQPKPHDSGQRQLRLAGAAELTPHHESRGGVYQSLVYDAKTAHVARLKAHGFTPGEDLFLLNPLDERAMVWDIARDVRTMSEAQEFAALVVADVTASRHRTSTSQHFQETARGLVTEVVQVLQRTDRWRLRDLIEAFDGPERIAHVLKQHRTGGGSVAHLKASEEGASVYSTLRRYLRGLSIVAASWDAIERRHGARRLLSLDDWVAGGEGTVLLLPDGNKNETVTRPFNQFVFRRLMKRMLAPDELGTSRVRTVFLDELPTTGRLPQLEALLATGRDYGMMVTLGVQDIGQMFNEYGKDTANTIINNCPYRAYMKSLGDNARWCADQVGKQVVQWHQQNFQYNQGRNQGSGQALTKENSRVWLDNYQQTMSSSFGANVQEREQDALMPAFFTNLPDIEKRRVVAGYYAHPDCRIWFDVQNLSPILEGLPWEPRGEEAKRENFVEVPADFQVLRPWEEEDYQRLELPVPEEDGGAADRVPSATPHRRRRPAGGRRTRRRGRPGPGHDF